MIRRLVTAVAIAFVAGWFVFLRPQALGGDTAYILVSGTSMEPTIHAGSLAIVVRQPRYAVGDVVAYRIRDGEVGAGLNVIHRIIGGSASAGYLMRGDNAPATDLWQPVEHQIVGRAVLVVPAAMPVLLFLRSPIVIASLAASCAVYLILGLWSAPNPQARRRRSPLPSTHVAGPRRQTWWSSRRDDGRGHRAGR